MGPTTTSPELFSGVQESYKTSLVLRVLVRGAGWGVRTVQSVVNGCQDSTRCPGMGRTSTRLVGTDPPSLSVQPVLFLSSSFGWFSGQQFPTHRPSGYFAPAQGGGLCIFAYSPEHSLCAAFSSLCSAGQARVHRLCIRS